MNIFEGLQFCFDNQFRRISAHGIKPIFFHCTEKLFLIEQPDGGVTEFNINSPILFHVSFEPVIEKVPLSDIFDKWCDGEQLYCEINGEKWETLASRPEIFKLDGVMYKYISRDLAREPIWWVQE